MADTPGSTTDNNVINAVQELTKLLSDVCLSVKNNAPKMGEKSRSRAYKLNSVPVNSFLERNLCVQPRCESDEQPIYLKGTRLFFFFVNYRFIGNVRAGLCFFFPIKLGHITRVTRVVFRCERQSLVCRIDRRLANSNKNDFRRNIDLLCRLQVVPR